MEPIAKKMLVLGMQFLLTMLTTATLAAVIVLIVLVVRRKPAPSLVTSGTMVPMTPSAIPTILPLVTEMPKKSIK